MKIRFLCVILSVSALLMPLSLPVSASESEERELLALAAESAASGESYTVMAALASVLVNRMKSSSYPDSLAAVISDAGIDISSAVPSKQALRAASDALGGFDPTSGALRYSREGVGGVPILLETDGWSFY